MTPGTKNDRRDDRTYKSPYLIKNDNQSMMALLIKNFFKLFIS